MRAITEINVHCSDTLPNWLASGGLDAQFKEIRRWHVIDNGWPEIAYHYVIGRDGNIKRGRPHKMVGSFEPRVNAKAIGICLIGGRKSSPTDPFEKHYTPEQDETLRKLIDRLQRDYPGIKKVTGHNDYANRACPGFKVQRWLAGQAPQRAFTESGTAAGSGAAVAAGAGLGVVEVVQVVAASTEQVKATVAEVQTAKAEVQAAPADPLRWVLLAVIVVGAAYALYRRWVDWKAGRQ
jgi:hypothetical protein